MAEVVDDLFDEGMKAESGQKEEQQQQQQQQTEEEAKEKRAATLDGENEAKGEVEDDGDEPQENPELVVRKRVFGPPLPLAVNHIEIPAANTFDSIGTLKVHSFAIEHREYQGKQFLQPRELERKVMLHPHARAADFYGRPEVVVRHRFADGALVSNGQVVQWSDGSLSLLVGDEYFDLGEKANTKHDDYVFVDVSAASASGTNNLLTSGSTRQRFFSVNKLYTAAAAAGSRPNLSRAKSESTGPVNAAVAASTAAAASAAAAAAGMKKRTLDYTVAEDPEKEKLAAIKREDERAKADAKLRAKQRKGAARYSFGLGEGLSAGLLEDDEPGSGGGSRPRRTLDDERRLEAGLLNAQRGGAAAAAGGVADAPARRAADVDDSQFDDFDDEDDDEMKDFIDDDDVDEDDDGLGEDDEEDEEDEEQDDDDEGSNDDEDERAAARSQKTKKRKIVDDD